MGSRIGFAVPQVTDLAGEATLADLQGTPPELSVQDVFSPLKISDILSGLRTPKDSELDQQICSNTIAVIDTFRVAAQEIRSFVSENVKQIRAWKETDTPSAERLITNVALISEQVRTLGDVATAVVKAPEKYLGANDRRAPGPDVKPESGYVFDVANSSHRIVGELGRKADMFASAIEAFQLDLAEFGRFADQDRLRHGEVTTIKKQAISIEAQARSFERDTLTIDGPEGSRAFQRDVKVTGSVEQSSDISESP